MAADTRATPFNVVAAVFAGAFPQLAERRVIVDRRSEESTVLWLKEVDRRHEATKYGRREWDDQLEQARYELRQEQARDARDPRDRYSL